MLMAGSKAGRRKKSGPRYPSGKLVPADELPGALLWQRIRERAVKGALDERMGSLVGRWHLDGYLTALEVAAANEIRNVYALFHKHEGLRPNAKSASLEAGFGGSVRSHSEMTADEIALQLSDARQLPQTEERDHLIAWLEDYRATITKPRARAKKRWETLLACFPNRLLPDALYRFCVLDLAPWPGERQRIKSLLAHVGATLNLNKSPGSMRGQQVH